MKPMLRDADQIAPADYPPGYPLAPQPTAQAAPPTSASPAAPLSQPAVASPAAANVKPWPALAAGFIAVCCMNNLMAGPLIDAFHEPPSLIGFVFGMLLTQIAALSLWTVWSERPVWQRQLCGMLLAEVLLAFFLVGIGSTAPGPRSNFVEVARAMACSLPLILLAVQMPLWALRIYAGWRIVLPASDAQPPGHLSIRDILQATVVVAVAVSLLRLASDDPEFFEVAWIAWAVALPCIAAASLLALPEALFIVLRWERPIHGLYAIWAYATVAIFIVLVIGATFFRVRIPGEEVIVTFVTIYVLAGFWWILLRVVRSGDYRLVTGG